MRPEVTIIDTLPGHVASLKTNLRSEDVSEVLRLGMSVQQSLWYGYRKSVYCKTAFIDCKPVAMWGVLGTFLGTKGQCWLMTTPDIYKISPLRFARIYQEEVSKMLKLFTVIENYVDNEYTAAIRLLDICDFSIGDPEAVGATGAMYRRFWIGRN